MTRRHDHATREAVAATDNLATQQGKKKVRVNGKIEYLDSWIRIDLTNVKKQKVTLFV